MIEKTVLRIISGYVKYTRPDFYLIIRQPSLFTKIRAEELWQEYFDNCIAEGDGMSNEEYEHFLLKQKIWTKKKQEKLETLPKDLEDLKLKYFELYTNSGEAERLSIKKVIKKVKEDIYDLSGQKFSRSYLTAKGMADIFKSKYLIGMSTYKNKEKLFKSESEYLNHSLFYFDDLYSYYCKTRLSESEIRSVARSDEWRGYWSCSKNGNPFGKTIVKLTDEQRMLISWSKLYDNIVKHPEKPIEEIINDDDALDGWMISQRRKKKLEEEEKAFEDKLSDKIKDADELFFIAKTQEEANAIYRRNDDRAKQTIASRQKIINEKGTISEFEMPDTKAKLKMEFNKRRAQLGGK